MSERGVRVATSDPEAFRSQFYSFRIAQRKRGNFTLDTLSLSIRSPEEVWLLKEASDAQA